MNAVRRLLRRIGSWPSVPRPARAPEPPDATTIDWARTVTAEREKRRAARALARQEAADLFLRNERPAPADLGLTLAILSVAAAIDDAPPPAPPQHGDVVIRVSNVMAAQIFTPGGLEPARCTKGLPQGSRLVGTRFTAGALELWFRTGYHCGEVTSEITPEFKAVIEAEVRP